MTISPRSARAAAVLCGLALSGSLGISSTPSALARPQAPQGVAVTNTGDGRTPLTGADASGTPSLAAMYQRFYSTYQLAADDQISVRLVGQPEYSLENIKVSPLGRIYHPLLGDIDVAGMTIAQLSDKLKDEFREYFKSPRVSVDLVVANSAKIGVVGDVGKPGILVLTRPLTVLDAISESGGFTDFGSKSDVTVLRTANDGQPQAMEVNVKRIMEGKARAGENMTLLAGDTVIVHGNAKKTISTITSIAGFGSFVNFIRLGRNGY